MAVKKFFLLTLLFLSLLLITLPAEHVLASSSPPPKGNPSEPCPNNQCDTAIGKIDVSSPVSVIMKIFSIVLTIGGSAALILIIYSGYKLLTSRGNKEAIQAARETITSAIVGLLFIVFSLVILSVVAGDVLKIPGFG